MLILLGLEAARAKKEAADPTQIHIALNKALERTANTAALLSLVR